MKANVSSVNLLRLEQAKRVMSGLDEHTRRKHLNMNVFARETDCGTVACVAGFCGLDPWFIADGFVTFAGYLNSSAIGGVSVNLLDYFGTEEPFFPQYYPEETKEHGITVEDTIVALDKAIAVMRTVLNPT